RLNRVTSYTRDALGRTASVTDPENRLVEFRYNGADQITNLITWVAGQPRIKHFDFTPSKGFSSRPLWRLQTLPKRDTSEKKFRALG
ncbi:MAG: RHS repeat protein, partial [Verrucomicrobiae bacterium]|nr:RHS repeat protein [Verrucomicrobiae bacterium]